MTATRRVMVLAAVAVLVVSCVSARQRWAQAQERDTIDAYLGYLAAFPEGEDAPEARERIRAREESVKWEQVISRDTRRAYEEYLRAYPEGDRAPEARRIRADELAWERAERETTASAYLDYLSAHPAGRHRGEAVPRADELLWAEVERKGTRDAYERYRDGWSHGARVDAARERIELITEHERLLEDVGRGPMPKRIGEFLREHPDSPIVGEAVVRLWSWLEQLYPEETFHRSETLETLRKKLPVATRKTGEPFLVAFAPLTTTPELDRSGDARYTWNTVIRDLAGCEATIDSVSWRSVTQPDSSGWVTITSLPEPKTIGAIRVPAYGVGSYVQTLYRSTGVIEGCRVFLEFNQGLVESRTTLGE